MNVLLPRSGVAGDVDPSQQEIEVAKKVAALMRLFVKDACQVAGRYVHAHERRRVHAADMNKALMFCARTFFEDDEKTMFEKVNSELQEMDEEDEGEEYEGEEDDEGEEEDEGEEYDEGEEEDEGEEYDEQGEFEAPTTEDVRFANKVDTIANCWHLWSPSDPVHQMIKRAIDNVAVS